MLSCKEITEICCDEDRRLGPLETMKFWMHLGICKACAAYKKQIEYINQTVTKVMKSRFQIDDIKLSNLEKEIIEKASKDA